MQRIRYQLSKKGKDVTSCFICVVSISLLCCFKCVHVFIFLRCYVFIRNIKRNRERVNKRKRTIAKGQGRLEGCRPEAEEDLEADFRSGRCLGQTAEQIIKQQLKT